MEDGALKNHISRRTFMTRHAAACLAAGWTASFPDRARSQATAGADIPDVAVVRGEPAKAVARAFDLLGGAGRFIGTGATVLLKPNVSFPNPERFGSTTSPAVVRAVAMLALNAGASRVIVADHTMQDSTRCFDRTGIREAVDGLDGARIIALDREVLFTETAVPGGKALSKVGIAKLIERSDVLINMPCAKSHTATQVSFGLKNLMGLIWDRTHFHTETDLDTAIAELATVIRPQLTLLDATRALVTGGPTGPGKVQELNTVIAGVNPLAVDVYAMTIAPWNNRSVGAQAVRHLAAAADIGLGVIDAASLSVVQETV